LWKVTKDFKVRADVHQASALNPNLFVLVIYEVTKDIQGDVPWFMMFIDDIGLVRENLEEVKIGWMSGG
jgi:hypothetical protein